MWLASDGHIWYESLQDAGPTEFLPGVSARVLSVSAATRGTETASEISGKPIFPFRLQLPSTSAIRAPVDTFATKRWVSQQSAVTYLAADSEGQRIQWMSAI